MTSLFEQLGGQATINLLVGEFYQRILGDPLLAPIFSGIDQQRLQGHQQRFLALALGGPNQYQGRDLGQAHAAIARRHGLNDQHFDAVLGHLTDSLRKLGAPEEPIRQVLAIAESTRAMVLGRAPQAAVA